jgi:hypothetical protein
MSKISPAFLYRELLVVDRQLVQISKLIADTLEASRATTRDTVEWRVKIDAFKKEHGFWT